MIHSRPGWSMGLGADPGCSRPKRTKAQDEVSNHLGCCPNKLFLLPLSCWPYSSYISYIHPSPGNPFGTQRQWCLSQWPRCLTTVFSRVSNKLLQFCSSTDAESWRCKIMCTCRKSIFLKEEHMSFPCVYVAIAISKQYDFNVVFWIWKQQTSQAICIYTKMLSKQIVPTFSLYLY